MQENVLLLDTHELALVKKKNKRNQLTFAIMLKYFQLENRYPQQASDIDLSLKEALLLQLNISAENFEECNWNGRTTERFRADIRDYLGYREATTEDSKKLIDWLMKEHLKHAPLLEKTQELAYEYFQENRIEPFSDKQLIRYVKSAHNQFEEHLFDTIYNALSEQTRQRIEDIIPDNESDTESNEMPADNAEEKITPQTEVKLRHLKEDIRSAKLKHVEFELKKLAVMEQFELPHTLLEQYPNDLVKKYYLRILVEYTGLIRRRPKKDYCAMMALFLHYRSQHMLDSTADMFTQLTHKMRTRSEAFIGKRVTSDVKHVNGKFDILYRLASVASQNPEGIIQEKIYPVVSKERLGELITDLDHKGKWYQGEVNLKIHSLYATGSRPMLLALLDVFDFQTHLTESKPLLAAVTFILENKALQDTHYSDTDKVPVENVLPSQWSNLVIESDAGDNKKIKINRMRYEIAILETLVIQLNCKKIWITGAYRYRNPYYDMPPDFAERQEFYYDWLGLPMDGKAFVKLLQDNTHEGLKRLNETILQNSKVKLKKTKKGSHITLTLYEAQPEPPTLNKLHMAIQKRWSTINLIDILKETNLREDFTRHLQTVACREHLPRDILTKRLLLALFGIGSNAGLKRIQASNDDVNYADLLYIKKRFLHVDNVRAAIVEIVNAIRRIRDPFIWGVASTGCACDSTHVAAWEQNLLSQFHPRYKKQGVMIYWHVDKKAACIYSQLKTCTSSEVGSMITGFLKHDTEMNMDKTYVDTHGQSIIGFAVSHLLGFKLLPRLKNLRRQKLFYPNANDRNLYSNLDVILEGSIDWKLIEENYDEVVKHMVALKRGDVDADVLIKRFSKDNNKHPVYKALIEIGKAVKTQFLCHYLEEEALRIEIHEALNVVERLNGAMNFIFYGNLGEITTNKMHDQELTVVCLHLLQVCMVYINTLIIQEILAEPQWKNVLTAEDLRALSPLIYGHINPYGLFPLDLVQRLNFNVQKFTNETSATAVNLAEVAV